MENLSSIATEAKQVALELIELAGLSAGQVVVVGCSSSEVIGSMMGHDSSPETGDIVFSALYDVFHAHGIYMAAQCCEHLNRALITEREAFPNAEIVNVIPQPKAGGSFATAAYHHFTHPIALEEIKADAGIDIGSTLIGMHLKKVAVPLRLKTNHIGEAYVTAARTRAKYIGGCRAHYDESLG